MKKINTIADLLGHTNYIDIPEMPGYVISKDCKVVSKNYMRRGYPKILKPWINKFGYTDYQLCVNGKVFRMLLSRLMLISFVGSPPNKDSQARHLDGNPRNNDLSNLAWGSPKENQQDRFQHGTDCAGERSPTAKFTEDQVREIRESKVPARQLAREFDVYHTTILQIRKRKTWKHIQ